MTNPEVYRTPGEVGVQVYDVLARDLPQVVAACLLRQNTDHYDKRRQFQDVSEFDTLWGVRARGDAGVWTYAASGTDVRRRAYADRLVHVVDIATNGEVLGEGVVRLSERGDSATNGRPYVVDTYTAAAHRGRGLGRRRLMVLNTLVRQHFGLLLCSHPNCPEDERRLWRSLTRDRLAEPHPVSGGYAYGTAYHFL